MNPTSFGHIISRLVCVVLFFSLVSGLASAQDKEVTKSETKSAPAEKEAKTESSDSKGWKPLQGSWEACQFGGDGSVDIEDKLIKFGYGDPLTGIYWEDKDKVLRENFEIELEARRTDGFDFFCALTFPVGKDQVSFVVGGWGGGVVGISSVDGRDASDNDTTSFRNFDNEKWYKIRVRVDPHYIRCWIGDVEACAQPRKDHEFGIRYEMDPCVPLGVAAFQCKAEYRGIRFRKLNKEDLAWAKKEYEEDNQ